MKHNIPAYCVTAYAQMRNGNLRRRVLTVHADDEHKAVAQAVKEIKEEDPDVSIVAAVMDVSRLDEREKDGSKDGRKAPARLSEYKEP